MVRRILLSATWLTAVAIGAVAIWFGIKALPPRVVDGSVRVESDPQGAEVRIDGTSRGTTPLALTLPAGRYGLTVQLGSSVKQMPIEISGGAGSAYHITWADRAATNVPEPIATGSLSVTSDAAGGVVLVDGTERGRTPLTVRDLPAGRHEIVIRSANTTYRRSVQVDPGATASLVISAAQAATPWGWIAMVSPFVVQVREGGNVIGTSDVDRILLPPGDHQLEFVSEPFGFRDGRRVSVSAGRAASVPLEIPRVPMNINALPWAEVFIDGVRAGDTPLANLMQPLGDHEIVFRHPQLGEKRQVVRVRLGESPRISVDMRSR